jgi:hypothetical protein
MIIDVMRDVFLWCFVMNFVFLLLWAGMLVVAKDGIYRIHSRFIRITEDQFNIIHYAGMMVFKMIIVAFNLVPFIALNIAG